MLVASQTGSGTAERYEISEVIMQVKAVETMVEMRRQELHRAAVHGSSDVVGKEKRAAQRSAAGIPVSGGRAVRRAVAPRVGSWLIHAGVRLGGASIRTS